MSVRTGGVAAFVVVLQLVTPDPISLVTVPQRDARRAARDPPSADISADGRFVAFESYASLVPIDTNARRDVYVLERVSGEVTLETDATDARSDHRRPRISGNGRYLVFESVGAASTGTPPRVDVALCDRWNDTTRVLTVGIGGALANQSSRAPDISDDGQVVVFSSDATNLTAGGDVNGDGEDVYLLNVPTGAVQRISRDYAGAQRLAGTSFSPAISGDGRWVAFASTAPLHQSDAHQGSPQRSKSGVVQIFLRDLERGTTARVSAPTRGHDPDGDSSSPAISGDGRFVAYESRASNLVNNDKNRSADVFLFDRIANSTILVSRAPDGAAANGASGSPALSADGRFVAFHSDASNLECDRRCPSALEDINLLWDVFVLDREKNVIVRVSADPQAGWMESSNAPALAASGLVVAFSSRHPIDTSDRADDFDLFVRAPKR
jgi:Tol biopolymer transport system component